MYIFNLISNLITKYGISNGSNKNRHLIDLNRRKIEGHINRVSEIPRLTGMLNTGYV